MISSRFVRYRFLLQTRYLFYDFVIPSLVSQTCPYYASFMFGYKGSWELNVGGSLVRMWAPEFRPPFKVMLMCYENSSLDQNPPKRQFETVSLTRGAELEAGRTKRKSQSVILNCRFIRGSLRERTRNPFPSQDAVKTARLRREN
jgi:hypothetical protein